MGYFRLFPDVLHISGPLCGAIYLLSDRKVHKLDKHENAIMSFLLDRNTIEAAEDKFGRSVPQLIQELLELSCGTEYEHPVHAEMYSPITRLGANSIFDAPPIIECAYIQLDRRCHARCSFCGNAANLLPQGCNSCIRWPGSMQPDYMDGTLQALVIKQLKSLEARKVVISGGNALETYSETLGFVSRLMKDCPRIKIQFNTPGVHDAGDLLKELKNYNVELVVSVFGVNEEEYQHTLGSAGFYNDLLDTIDFSNRLGMDYSCTVVANHTTKAKLEEMQTFVFQMSSGRLFTTEILETPVNDVLNSITRGVDRIESIGMEEIHQRQLRNSCLNGSVAVATDGSVRPCPMWPESFHGIWNGDISLALRRGDLMELWRLTKEKVHVCSKCEYVFACSDCSILERESAHHPSLHKAFCAYDPKTGEWASG